MTAERIREIRRKLFMTQKEFARVLGVHWISVSDWERNNETPSLKNQKKIFELCKENNIKIEDE